MHKWTSEQLQFLKDNYPGYDRKTLLIHLNDTFGLSLTLNQLVACLKNHKTTSGRTGRYEKGHMSWNAGKKGLVFSGSEKGWFKKGQKPHNYKPVGSERIDEDGYIIVKISDAGKWHERWRHKHKVVWEKERGTIPVEHVVIFLDGDKTNCSIENLACISNAMHLQMNRNGLRFDNPQITSTAINIAELLEKTRIKEGQFNDAK